MFSNYSPLLAKCCRVSHGLNNSDTQWDAGTFNGYEKNSLAPTGFELVTERTGKRVFLEEMNLLLPWTELVGLIQSHALSGAGAKGGRPAYSVGPVSEPRWSVPSEFLNASLVSPRLATKGRSRKQPN